MQGIKRGREQCFILRETTKCNVWTLFGTWFEQTNCGYILEIIMKMWLWMEFGGFQILLNFDSPFSCLGCPISLPDFNTCSSFKWEGSQVGPQDNLSVMREEAGHKAKPGAWERPGWQNSCLFPGGKWTAQSKQIHECNQPSELFQVWMPALWEQGRLFLRRIEGRLCY